MREEEEEKELKKFGEFVDQFIAQLIDWNIV